MSVVHQKLAHEIEASIRRVERMKIEPRMLAENIQQLNTEESRLQSTTGMTTLEFYQLYT